jgi:hypothetical protein
MFTPHCPLGIWHFGRTCVSALLAVAGGLLFIPASVSAAPYKWAEIPVEHLNAKPETPDAEEAGAEVLVSQRGLGLNVDGVQWDTFTRLKLYSERMVEEAGRVRIYVQTRQELSDCGARVIRQGAVQRVYDRKDFKRTKAIESEDGAAGMYQMQIADLQPGDLLEVFHVLRYDASEYAAFGSSYVVPLQEPWPIRELEYTVGTRGWAQGGMEYGLSWTNLPGAEKSKSGGDQIKVRAKNLRAYRKEKDAPPEKDLRAYLAVDLFVTTYAEFRPLYRDWEGYVKYRLESLGGEVGVNGAIKKQAAELTQGAASPDEKLRRLHDFCQREIFNLTYEEPGSRRLPTKQEMNELNAARTLERRLGHSYSITCLFVALARAAGFEATLARTTYAREMLRVDRLAKGWLFLDNTAAAVKLDGKWNYYSPGMRWAPFGQMYWQNQGTAVLPIQKGKATWEIRPIFTALDKDKLVRTGRFTLTEHGALTGTVTETLDGQHAMIWRHRHKGKKLPDREKFVRTTVRNHFPLAQVSAVKIEDDGDNYHPVVLRYELKVPDFATLAGGRIIFAPSVLSARAKPRYTDTAPRLNPIRFQYSSVVEDHMELILPEHYELEAGDAPRNVDYGEAAGIKYLAKLSYAPKQQLVTSATSLTIGLGGKITFPAKGYRALMQVFDDIHKAQTHTLVLKPKAGYTPPPPPAPVEAPAEETHEEEAENVTQV